MKKSLIQDIKRSQFFIILTFAIFMFIMGNILIWNQVFITQEARLLSLSKIINLVIEENHNLFLDNSVTLNKMHDLIEPGISKAVGCFPPNFAGGFYSCRFDKVVSSISNDNFNVIDGLTISWEDQGRKSWEFKKTQYSISRYGPFRKWVLKCDNPVIINGVVIGHSFTNIPLSGLITVYLKFVLILLFISLIAGYFSVFTNTTKKIQSNISRLKIIENSEVLPEFDYDEFNRIAALNQKAYHDLKLSEKNKAEMLENFPWCYIVIDASGKCIDINEEAARIMHKKKSDLIGATPGPRLTGPMLTFEALRKNAKITTEIAMDIERTGKKRFFYACSFPIDLSSGESGAMSWFIDMTELTETREALIKSSQKIIDIFESIQDAFYVLDYNWNFVYVNEAVEKITGKNRAELIGKSAIDLFPESKGTIIENEFQRAAEEKTPVHFQTSQIQAGKTLEIHAYPFSWGLTVYYRDITERYQAEEARARLTEALDTEKERLTVTLRSIGDGVIAVNEKGRIILMNEVAEKITGYSQQEALGQPLFKIFNMVNDKTSEPYHQVVNKVIHSCETIHLSNIILVTKELAELVISVNCAPIRSPNQKYSGAVLVFQDITEKQKTELELLKTEKMESLGILAGGIAHDFNNILAALLSNIQLTLHKLKKGQTVDDYLREAVEITYKASNLTKQLLTFSKGGAPIIKPASINELIKDTVNFALRGSNVKCQFDIPDDLRTVHIDEGQISQVIHNLVINAKQAMPKGGLIEIYAKNETVNIGGQFNPGNYVKIAIKDNGIGIPKEHLTKIFDPFFTTKKEGTGLGLSTSYSIIKRHNGYIDVFSKEKSGATFFIYLPATYDFNIEKENKIEVASTKENLRILLMDDEEMIRKVVGEMLNQFGYWVTLAKDGQEAIDLYRKAKESGELFDVVIMDLTVPGGIGGQEAIVLLRDLDPEVRAIVSSGYANDPVLADYKSYGFCGVVVKPYKIDELSALLNKVIV